MNTKQTEALKLALEALKGGLWDYGPGQDEHRRCNEVIAICEAALAEQPAQQQMEIAGRKVTIDWKTEALELRELVRLGGIKIAELEALSKHPAPATELREQQEPVGWVDDGGTVFWKDNPPADGADLYTSPQPAQPSKPLTDDDLDDIAMAARIGNLYDLRLTIEAKLRELNEHKEKNA